MIVTPQLETCFSWQGDQLVGSVRNKQLWPYLHLRQSVALSVATQEAVWLRRLLVDLKENSVGPPVMMEDNQGTIAMAKNPVSHARTKHIDIRYHYVREAVQKVISLNYCPTENMTADILTKPLAPGRFESLLDGNGNL